MPPPKVAIGKDQVKAVKVLTVDQQLCAIRFSPDGKLLAAGSFEGVIRRWDFSNDKFTELAAIKGHNGWVQRVAFHGDGKRLFAADTWGQLTAWPITEAEPKPLWSVKDAHDGWIHGLALSPDGSKLATAGRDKTVRISSTSDGKKEAVYPHPEIVLTVAFHPDGKSLVSGDHKGIIRQWELATGKLIREFDAKSMYLKDRLQDVGGVRSMAFTADGTKLVAGGSSLASGGFVTGTTLILIFDWKTGKLEQTFKGTGDKDGFVHDMAMHPDGYLIAVSSGQPGSGKVFFQRLTEAEPFFQLPLPNCHGLAVQPESTRIVVSATNANSAGNGRVGKDKENYPGNTSPLHVLDVKLPKG